MYVPLSADGSIELDTEVAILTSNVPRFISWPVSVCVYVLVFCKACTCIFTAEIDVDRRFVYELRLFVCFSL